MGFDKNDSQPLVRSEKKTTQVNIFLTIAIVVFFVISAFVLYLTATHKPQTREDALRPAEAPPTR